MKTHYFPHELYIDFQALAESKYFPQNERFVQELLIQLRNNVFPSDILLNTLCEYGILRPHQSKYIGRTGYKINFNEVESVVAKHPLLANTIQIIISESLNSDETIIWNTILFHKFAEKIEFQKTKEDIIAKANKNDE
jgi:hypothetical protein